MQSSELTSVHLSYVKLCGSLIEFVFDCLINTPWTSMIQILAAEHCNSSSRGELNVFLMVRNMGAQLCNIQKSSAGMISLRQQSLLNPWGGNSPDEENTGQFSKQAIFLSTYQLLERRWLMLTKIDEVSAGRITVQWDKAAKGVSWHYNQAKRATQVILLAGSRAAIVKKNSMHHMIHNLDQQRTDLLNICAGRMSVSS